MAVDKNFIVRNGLEVGGTLIWAQAGSGKVGINTTQFEGSNIFQVAGGIGATNLTVSQSATFYNAEVSNSLILDDAVISIGGSIGGVNQYVRSTGSGLAWADLPISQKFASNFTATLGQSTFAATYVVGLVDVYINGVRLTDSEYVAVDGATISLLNPCFGGENIDIVGQATIGLGSTDAIQGITVLEEGIPVGAAANITSINFVGAAVTAVGLGVGVTVYIDPSQGESQYWNPIGTTGIQTSRRVAIGTQSLSGSEILRVQGDVRVTGILTVGESSITFNGQNNTIGIGTGTVINETGITVGIISATTITGSLTGAASSVTVTNSVSTTTTYYPTFASSDGQILVDQNKLLYQPSSGELKAGSVNVSGLTSTRTLRVFSGISGGLTITGITTINSGGLQFGTGLENVKIGYNAAPNVTGNSNIAIGDQPLSGITTGSTNIAIGQYTLDTLTDGSHNIAIGERAGRFLTGSNNVIIGKFDGNSNNLDIRTTSNNIVFADGQGNIRQYINSLGRVGFNTYNPISNFHVVGNSVFTGIVTASAFVGDGSGLTNIPGSTSYWATSGIGIHTLSNVGIGTTNPTSALTVQGNLSVSGISTFNDNIRIGADDKKLQIGDGNDIEIYHSSGVNYIEIDNGASLSIKDNANTRAVFQSTGAVDLYYGANKKFETIGAGVTVTGTTFTNQLSVSGVSTFIDDVKISEGSSLDFGSGAGDLHIYRQSGGSSDSIIKYDGSYNFKILSDITTLASSAGSVTWGVFGNNGVELYYGNSKKFETIGAGVTVTGTTFTNQLSVSGVSTFQAFNSYVEIGNPSYYAGLRLISGGTEARVVQSGSGDLYLTSDTNRNISLNTYSTFGDLNSLGNVQLNNGGVGITKVGSAITFTANTGNIQAASLSVSGVSTFQNDVKVAEYSYGTNSNQITLGNNKFRIYSDGSNTYLKNYDTNTGGDLYIETDELLIRKYDGTETIAQFTEGAGVKLNYQGIKKFETIGAGVTITETTFTNQLSVSGVSTFQNNVYLGDSDVLNLGDSNDLQISHNPGVTPYNFINGGTTLLTIRSGDLDIQSGSQNYTSFSATNTDTRISWAGTNSNANRIKVDQTSVELYADVKILPVDSFPARFSVGTGGTVITTTSSGLVGIGTTNPSSKLTVRDGDISVGVGTAHGVILTSPNGTQYRLIVDNSGILSTVAV